MEFIFFNALMKPKLLFGTIPYYYLKFCFTVAGISNYIIGWFYALIIFGILIVIGFLIFPGMEDKNQLKFMFYNLFEPKKLSF